MPDTKSEVSVLTSCLLLLQIDNTHPRSYLRFERYWVMGTDMPFIGSSFKVLINIKGKFLLTWDFYNTIKVSLRHLNLTCGLGTWVIRICNSNLVRLYIGILISWRPSIWALFYTTTFQITSHCPVLFLSVILLWWLLCGWTDQAIGN